MNDKNKQIEIARFIAYTKACLKACAKNSEEAVTIVEKVMDAVLQDAGRISSMTHSTLDAVRTTRDLVRKNISEHAEKPVGEIVHLLQRLTAEHKEIDNFTMPIIQALQFQDRTRQQMENLILIVSLWSEHRAKVQPTSNLEEKLHEFGLEMLKVTTTDEERAAVRAVISTLPQEQKIASDDEYF